MYPARFHFSLLVLFGLLTCSSMVSLAQLPSSELHGFASQGFMYSKGNNFYGDSLDGSWEYYEAGINANIRLSNRFDISGQLLVRDAGGTDDGRIRTDYLFLDYRALDRPNSTMGVRVGRIRNFFGFYNASRDVVFTRPSILLPQSVYYEGNGVRELLFSSDGAQIYGQWNHEDSSTDFIATVGKEREISNDILTNLAGALPLPENLHAELEEPLFAQLTHEMQGGIWRLAASIGKTELNFNSAFIDLALDVNVYVLSLQRNWERLTLTSEYSLSELDFKLPFTSETMHSDGLYLQAEYRLNPSLTLISRYDYSASDQDERSDTDAHDLLLGLRWQPNHHWMIDVNLHGMRGTNGIPLPDNTEPLSERTELLSIMASFRF